MLDANVSAILSMVEFKLPSEVNPNQKDDNYSYATENNFNSHDQNIAIRLLGEYIKQYGIDDPDYERENAKYIVLNNGHKLYWFLSLPIRGTEMRRNTLRDVFGPSIQQKRLDDIIALASKMGLSIDTSKWTTPAAITKTQVTNSAPLPEEYQ